MKKSFHKPQIRATVNSTDISDRKLIREVVGTVFTANTPYGYKAIVPFKTNEWDISGSTGEYGPKRTLKGIELDIRSNYGSGLQSIAIEFDLPVTRKYEMAYRTGAKYLEVYFIRGSKDYRFKQIIP